MPTKFAELPIQNIASRELSVLAKTFFPAQTQVDPTFYVVISSIIITSSSQQRTQFIRQNGLDRQVGA